MQLNRFSGRRRFRHQILNQTTADARVAILGQKRDVSEHDRRRSSVDQHPANAAPVQKNDLIVYSRLGSFTSQKLHFDKGLLLSIVPTEAFQLFQTSAGVNFQQKGRVIRRRIAQREILGFVLQFKSPSCSFDLPRWRFLTGDADNSGALPAASRHR